MTKPYEIEKNVPITTRFKWRDVVEKMSVGDSIVVASKRDAMRLAQTVWNNYSIYRITMRRLDDKKSYRCWLIERERE